MKSRIALLLMLAAGTARASEGHALCVQETTKKLAQDLWHLFCAQSEIPLQEFMSGVAMAAAEVVIPKNPSDRENQRPTTPFVLRAPSRNTPVGTLQYAVHGHFKNFLVSQGDEAETVANIFLRKLAELANAKAQKTKQGNLERYFRPITPSPSHLSNL